MPHYRLIACEVFYREFCLAVARSPNIVTLHFMPQRIHALPSAEMAAELQKQVDATPDGKFSALLLGFGLCNNGLAGLRARQIPVVIPRAHDCITFFLGSRERYARCFREKPGSYYLTCGWLERSLQDVETLAGPQDRESVSRYQAWVDKYGEEDAQYLMEALGNWAKKYERMVYVDAGLGDRARLQALARSQAEKKGLAYEEWVGDLRLFHALVDGPPWSESEFLVVPPGQQIRPSYDDRILETRPNPEDGTA